MKIVEEDPWREMLKWLLMGLQVLAMAICAGILAIDYMADTLKIPHQMCVEVPAQNEAQ